MKIGIDASRANLDHKSGTEWYSYYIIRWLAKIDKDNEYILYTNKPLKGGLLDLGTKQYLPRQVEEKIEIDKRGYQKIKSPHNNFHGQVLKWPFKYFWTQGGLSWEMLVRRPDILFIPAHALPLIYPKRSVVTIHDIGYERQLKIYADKRIANETSKHDKLLSFLVKIFTLGKYGATDIDYLKWSTQHSLDRADRVIAISKFTKKDIGGYYQADAGKIKVIYNGYNAELFKKINDREKMRAILIKYDIEQPYLFYIGRIERKKNIPLLIEAFAIMRENNKDLKHKLVLVGDASFGYDEVKYLMREFDIVGDIIMPGWVEEAEIPYLYSGADAFVFPSNYEGFGIPLLQAMACEVPIAASNKTSIPEVTGEAALLFNPRYALSIAEAMQEIIVNKNLRERLVRLGGERVKNFSWEKCARETLDVITYK